MLTMGGQLLGCVVKIFIGGFRKAAVIPIVYEIPQIESTWIPVHRVPAEIISGHRDLPIMGIPREPG